MLSLVSIGDNVVDNYLDKGVYYPGGNAVNVAVFARRFGLERTSYIGLFGNDEEGAHVKQALKAEGVGIERCRTAIGENGKAYVRHDAEGDRVFGESNKGGIQSLLKLNFHQKDLDYIQAFSLAHTSVYSYLDESVELLSRMLPVSYDFSTNREASRLQQLCPHLEVAFFSGSDLTEPECLAFIDEIRALGTRHVIVTRGKDGALYGGEQGVVKQRLNPVEAVDTLGAGDSFIAAFLVSLIRKQPIEQGMTYAAECAARTCLEEGAFGYPQPIARL